MSQRRNWESYIGTTNRHGVKIIKWLEYKPKHAGRDKVICVCPICNEYFIACCIYDVAIEDDSQMQSCRKCCFSITSIKKKKDFCFNVGDTINEFEIKERFEKKVFAKSENRYKSEKWYTVECSCGNIFDIKESNLTKKNPVVSCGCVRSHGERITQLELNKYNIETSKQYTFHDLKGPKGGILKFDFAVLKNKQLVALIEFQGEQHRIDARHDFGKQQREITDVVKKEYCKTNDIPLYEIWFDEDIEQRVNEILTELNLSR